MSACPLLGKRGKRREEGKRSGNLVSGGGRVQTRHRVVKSNALSQFSINTRRMKRIEKDDRKYLDLFSNKDADIRIYRPEIVKDDHYNSLSSERKSEVHENAQYNKLISRCQNKRKKSSVSRKRVATTKRTRRRRDLSLSKNSIIANIHKRRIGTSKAGRNHIRTNALFNKIFTNKKDPNECIKTSEGISKDESSTLFKVTYDCSSFFGN
ncbi:unnamed protein product [Moneuplotes crassus]|uniref:Uncharacterized protein n=1 Tax=Euplotes crassus TaxID=5936 RepID=A0AAD1XJ93_EUPCR|nr:unnamed protein product [Moneuplotes crassus]